jgi:CheY-like chemotaxis protein
VQISVTDHGLGLPPEAISKLFQKFYRVEDSDRRTIKGTGLGLAICQKIVTSHGGRVWAESPGLGKGSTFSFTLPIAEDDGSSCGHVLIVEDDPNFARLLQAELSERGLSSSCALTAEVALERLSTVKPLAVMLDLLLPGLQGEAFLDRLAETSAAGVPVVVVSTKQLSRQDRLSLKRKGAVAIIRKGPGVASSAAEAIAGVLHDVVGAQAS